MSNKIKKIISGKFSLWIALLISFLLLVGFFAVKTRLSLASTASDTYSDTSKINTGASSNYVVTGGQLKMNYNTGADGALTLTTSKNINTDILTSRSYADGINYSVSALGSNTITTSSTPNGIAANDEVLLINMVGDHSSFSRVGNYEFMHVLSVAGSVITLTSNIVNTYGPSDNTTLTGQKIMVQRVPNYTNVTINTGITLSASSWDGTSGGVLAFRVSGTLTNNGTIDASSIGYRSGTPNCGTYGQANPSESRCGTNGSPNGICGGGAAGTGTGSASYGGCGGGGKGPNGDPGGGGGYGTGGQGFVNGTTNADGEGASGDAGSWPGGGGGSYGPANLSRLYLGSAGGTGGGGWRSASGQCNQCGYNCQCLNGGRGGTGGGVIFIEGTTLTAGNIYSKGANGGAGSNGCNGGAASGGGGSGGSIYLQGNTVTLGSGVSAAGGSSADYLGGVGRIAVMGNSVTGTASPAQTTVSASFPTAIIQSTNLLTGVNVYKINSFVYNLSSKPAGSTATIQFSQDASTWYNSAGTPGGTDTLTTGANNSISLSTLNWSGGNFYYKIAFGGPATPILDDATVSYTMHLEPPTIGTPTPLSTTSIRWNFTNNRNGETITGFKLYDQNGSQIPSGNTSGCFTNPDATYCDETGLSPGTTYTRKLAAYDGNGTGGYSGTVDGTTQASIPLAPTISSGTATTLNVDVVPGAGGSPTDTYAIYLSTTGAANCDGVNGIGYVAADGTITGSEVWQYDTTADGTPAWNTVQVTGLNLDNNIYSVCTKDKSAGGSQTVFGPADSTNGGYCPLAGCTLGTSGFTNKYRDGDTDGRWIYGLDNGSSTNANTAVLTLGSGSTITVASNETYVFGSLSLTGGSIILSNNGGQLKPGAKLWVVDGDSDGYPKAAPNHSGDPALYYGPSAPSNGRRRTAINTMAVTPDCNDLGTNASQVWAPHAVCYTDNDSDTYTTSTNANTTCLNTSSCDTATKASLAADNSAVSTFTAGQLRNSANGNDCNDSGTNANLVFISHAQCYADADGDTYTNGLQANSTCLNTSSCATATARSLSGDGNAVTSGLTAGSMQNSASATADCYDNNPNAKPSSSYCGTVYRGQTSAGAITTDNSASGNSYDYDCSGGDTFCGNSYNHTCTSSSACRQWTNKTCNTCSATLQQYSSVTQTCGDTTSCTQTATTTVNVYCKYAVYTTGVATGTQGCQ